jgi:hypothetical protein
VRWRVWGQGRVMTQIMFVHINIWIKKKKNKVKKKSNSWFFEKINKINKPLANRTWRRAKTQIKKIKHEKCYITTNANEILRLIRQYFENLYLHTLEYLDELDKFLNACIQKKLNEEDIKHWSRLITSNRIEAVIKSLPTKKSLGPGGFIVEFYQMFK